VNCTDFLAKLTDFFDGNIEPDLLAEVKQHLGSCHHCEVVVDTTRKTIEVYRGAEIYEFPSDVSDRLRAAIMARCEKHKDDSSCHKPILKKASAKTPVSG
jgi:anti-sigma factor RsiW